MAGGELEGSAGWRRRKRGRCFPIVGGLPDVEAHHTRRLTKGARALTIALTGSALLNESGKVYAMFTTERQAKGDALG